jgi:hypothetical protein
MTIEILASKGDETTVVDFSGDEQRLTKSPVNTGVESELVTILVKTPVINIDAVLTLNGVTIPAQGDGYLTVWADVYKDGYRQKIQISAANLTPAGPYGVFKAQKTLSNIPAGTYRVSLDFTSYWKNNGGFIYSTYVAILSEGKIAWSYELVGTPGQENPRYYDSAISLEVAE